MVLFGVDCCTGCRYVIITLFGGGWFGVWLFGYMWLCVVCLCLLYFMFVCGFLFNMLVVLGGLDLCVLVGFVVVLLCVGLWLGCCFCLCWLFGLGVFVDCWYELYTFFVFCYYQVFVWWVGLVWFWCWLVCLL